MRKEGGDTEQADENKAPECLVGFALEFNLVAFSVSLDLLNQRGFICNVML